MQNTKIQALWKLCQELKNRREILVDKMNQNQSYLDEQQWAMSEEVNQLKQENQHLFAQVHTLIEQVHQFKEQLHHYQAQEAQTASEPPVSSTVDVEELVSLHERYTAMANQLDVSDSLYQSRSALLEQLQKNSQNVHYEFKALKEANQSLSQDLEELKSKSDQLIELVENYRQAALEAYAEVEKMQEQNEHAQVAQANVESDATPTAENTEAFDSKAEAARDAVRKKIVLLLRHRLGKVPRDVSSALKEISNSKTMDQLFEQALSVESIEAFSSQLPS